MKFTIPGNPIPKKRHKCACRHNKPIIYDPQIKDDMQWVKKEILSQWNKAFDGENKEIVIEASNLTKAESFVVICTFLLPIPRSDNVGQKNAKLWGIEEHNIKPDFDNLAKFYLDCMKGIVFSDDSQVSVGVFRKFYDENPRTEIEIMVKHKIKVDDPALGVLNVFSPNKLREFLKDTSELFRKYPYQLVDGLIPSSVDIKYVKENLLNKISCKMKENILNEISCKMIDFSLKYGDDIKKIQRLKK